MIEILLSTVIALTAAEGGAWCDVVFRDVARSAEVVVLAEAEPSGKPPELRVVEVLKGGYERPTVEIGTERRSQHRVKKGDHVFLALDGDLQPVGFVDGMGACFAVSVLRLREGKLRARDRLDYDYGREELSLDALTELIRQDLHSTAWAR
jgi:hypothetical protein